VPAPAGEIRLTRYSASARFPSNADALAQELHEERKKQRGHARAGGRGG
jgi:hypothetical protein